MPLTISGDTPNFSAATITTVTSTTLSDGTNSTSTTNAIQGSAKAWVNFNGAPTSGSATIRASYNVSSVTINGTGNFTINFTNAFADTNYITVGSGGDASTALRSVSTNFAPSTSSIQINVVASNGTNATTTYVNVACFR
jgi:hypothetical protein